MAGKGHQGEEARCRGEACLARLVCWLVRDSHHSESPSIMPYSKQHKQETHERILRAAGRALREAGVDGVAIGELMARAGLTHGGFYAHFPSKDALVAEACARGMAESGEQLFAVATKAAAQSPGEGVHAFVDGYLSARHRDAPATGCMLPALAADVARSPGEVRTAFTTGIEAYLDRLATLLAPGSSRDDALVLLSGVVGAMLLARAVDDEQLSDRILAAARDFYTAAFAADGDSDGGHATPAASSAADGAGR